MNFHFPGHVPKHWCLCFFFHLFLCLLTFSAQQLNYLISFFFLIFNRRLQTKILSNLSARLLSSWESLMTVPKANCFPIKIKMNIFPAFCLGQLYCTTQGKSPTFSFLMTLHHTTHMQKTQMTLHGPVDTAALAYVSLIWCASCLNV